MRDINFDNDSDIRKFADYFIFGRFFRFFPFLLWLFFCFGQFCFLWFHPIKISFDLQAEQDCVIRLDYSCGKTFVKRNSFRETVTSCKNQYEFYLPYRACQIRLVLGKIPGNRISIQNFSLIRNGFLVQKRKILAESDVLRCHNVVLDGDGFKTMNQESYIDLSPFLLQSHSIDIRRLSLLLFVFFCISIVLLKPKSYDWMQLINSISSTVEMLKRYCIANRFFLIYAVCCLMILYGYELFNTPITDDDDWFLLSNFEYLENSMPGAYSYALSFKNLADLFICHGRWSNYLLLHIFPVYCPVISFLWCLGCMTCIFILLTEKLSLHSGIRYLLFPLFIGHPIFYMLLIYCPQHNFFGITCLIAFLSAVYWLHCRNRWGMICAMSAAVFAVGSLQSLILLFPLWFLLSKMSEGMERSFDYKKSFIDLVKLCGFCLLVLLGYALSVRYSLWVYGAKWEYLVDYIQKPNSFKSIIRFIWLLLEKRVLPICAGEYEFTTIHGQLLLFLLMAAAVIVRLIRKKRSLADILVMSVALAAILILPFALHVATFNTEIPTRSMVSFPIIMTGLCILGWRSLEDYPKLRLAVSILMFLVAVQYGILINQKSYADNLRYMQDKSILQSVKKRFYQIPDFTAALHENRKIPLAVVGRVPTLGKTFPFYGVSMLNCFHEPGVVMNLHMLGETYFYPASESEIKRILPVAMSMPSWPASGSVRYQDGIMIVKFSEFSPYQCQQFDLPFIPDALNIPFFRLKKLPARGKPFWVLDKDTCGSTTACTVDFTESGITVKPVAGGWPAVATKDLHADPRKMYCLQLDPKTVKGHGYLYLHFKNPNKSGEEIITFIEIHPGDANCVTAIPGRYLEGPVLFSLGNFPGKEYLFEKIALIELDSWEDILKDDIMKYKKQPEKNHKK